MSLHAEDRDAVTGVLREHVLVGGTCWDHERKTTFSRCQCGVECYLLDSPDHADHLADLLISEVSS